MKQVTISVAEERFDFFLELLRSLDFVSVQEAPVDKHEALQSIAEGMKEAILASEDKAPSRPAKDFLRELRS